jgi:hypothetical protein
MPRGRKLRRFRQRTVKGDRPIRQHTKKLRHPGTRAKEPVHRRLSSNNFLVTGLATCPRPFPAAMPGKWGNPPKVFSPAGEALARNCRKACRIGLMIAKTLFLM